jgi:hypothetical protein
VHPWDSGWLLTPDHSYIIPGHSVVNLVVVDLIEEMYPRTAPGARTVSFVRPRVIRESSTPSSPCGCTSQTLLLSRPCELRDSEMTKQQLTEA